MPLSRRYSPEHAPGETCTFGLDYSFVIPVGVAIASGEIDIFQNNAARTPADADFVKGPVQVRDRAIYASLSGGLEGVDYLFRWTAVDTQGNVWPRTVLCLVAETS